MSAKKPTFLSNQKNVHYLSWICAKVKNSCIFTIYLTSLTILQIFNLKGLVTKVSVKTVWCCCDLEIWSRSLKLVCTGKAQWVVPPCKVWHLSHLWCLIKSQSVSPICWLLQNNRGNRLHGERQILQINSNMFRVYFRANVHREKVILMAPATTSHGHSTVSEIYP